MYAIVKKYLLLGENNASCGTNSANRNGRVCIFPFKYKNKIYHKCTTIEEPKPWCSTKTSEGNHVTGEWGYCDSDCDFQYLDVRHMPNMMDDTNDSSSVTRATPETALSSKSNHFV